MLVAGPAIAVRFPTPGVSADWGMYLCDDRDYSLDHLPSPNARSHTRRGLARCRVERLDFHFLGEHGHKIGVDTYMRQNGMPPKETAESWAAYCSMFARYPGFEAWGAFVDGESGRLHRGDPGRGLLLPPPLQKSDRIPWATM